MDNIETGKSPHLLPTLSYDHAALEPYVDTQTMLLHHGKHHASYVVKLNSALEKFPKLHERNALWLLLNLSKVPQKIRAAVRNNAGGHVNHSLFWRAMSPATNSKPVGPLIDAIKHDFGSFKQFKRQFVETGKKLFGSGWVWLARAQDDGKLHIVTTTGHDHPMMKGLFPILVNDVWEHAYYLKYENRRVDYLNNWWAITNWEEAARQFEQSILSAEQGWEECGNHILRTAT